ncbi:MAG: AMP-binding protein [Actinomycetota bacterium]
MDLAQLLRDTAARLPDKKALTVASSGEEATYAELDAEVDRIATALQATGLSKGDRVAVGLPNSLQFVVAYFAVLRAGGVMIPLNIMLTTSEVKKVLFDSGARVAVTMDPFLDAVRKGAESTQVKHVI